MYPFSSQILFIFLIVSSFSEMRIILCLEETPVKLSYFSMKFERNVDFPVQIDN